VCLQDLQFIATNLHTQIWSVAESSNSSNAAATVSHYDCTTTGAPSGDTRVGLFCCVVANTRWNILYEP